MIKCNETKVYEKQHETPQSVTSSKQIEMYEEQSKYSKLRLLRMGNIQDIKVLKCFFI